MRGGQTDRRTDRQTDRMTDSTTTVCRGSAPRHNGSAPRHNQMDVGMSSIHAYKAHKQEGTLVSKVHKQEGTWHIFPSIPTSVAA